MQFSNLQSSGSDFHLFHSSSFPILISYGFSLSISFTNSWWDFPFLFFLSFDIHRTCVSFKGLDISRWGFNLQDKMVPTLRMTCQVLSTDMNSWKTKTSTRFLILRNPRNVELKDRYKKISCSSLWPVSLLKSIRKRGQERWRND